MLPGQGALDLIEIFGGAVGGAVKSILRGTGWEGLVLNNFFCGGVDGARTRDLWRDRPAF